MRKLRRFLLSLLLLSLPSILCAAVPPTPNLAAVQNFNGPILIFWDPGGAPAADTRFYVFISTTSMVGKTTDQLMTDGLVATYQNPYVAGRSAYELRILQPEANKMYYVEVAANDPDAGDWSGFSSQLSDTSLTEPLTVTHIYSAVKYSNDPYTLDYDSQTISFSASLGTQHGLPFLPPAKVRVDIQTTAPVNSVLSQAYNLDVTVTYSSSSFKAESSSGTWDGFVSNGGHEEHKHNGGYNIVMTPVDANNSVITSGEARHPIVVDVTHVNTGKGVVYTTMGINTPHYGPPFYYDYYLSKDCFVTWKIYDRNQTSATGDDTLIKVVVSTVPRSGGDSKSSLTNWDANAHRELWDGRDDRGFIVPNDVYRCTFDAIEFWGEPGSGFDPAVTDRSFTIEGTIAFDVLRIVDINATGITDASPLAHLKYTLTGANSLMGGATIKIAICTPGTTFYMASNSGTASYLNGAGTYHYVRGDPLPTDLNNLKKVFVFQRSAGTLDETWNGYDEAGTPLPNNTYVFGVSATDDSGNHAIDNSGDDHVIIGNVTIDRTAAQQASDSLPPTITAIAIDGTTILTGGGSTLTSPFSSITIQMNDPGGSGVDLINSTVTLTNPAQTHVALTATNNGVDTLTLTFGRQTTNGSYILRIRPKDKVGNTASDTICNFTLNAPVTTTPTTSPASFADSIIAYPNPAKGASAVTFSYTAPAATTVKLEVYSILGELIYEEQWNTASGAQTKTWNIVNKAHNRLASGMYLYRLTDQNSASKPKKLRKLIVIQ